MLLVATLVFFITRLAPGDPAAVMLGDQATAADIAKLRAVVRPRQAAAGAVRLLARRAWRTATSASRSSCSGR
jgi:ABC-type dipeptide/oligopeptide/nickel transport system permease component